MLDTTSINRSPIVIVGLTGSGKSTLARRLGDRTRLPIIEIGGIVMRDALACRICTSPLEHADHLIRSGNYLRFVERAARIAERWGPAFIVVGPRHPMEVHFLSAVLKAPLIMGLMVPEEVRRVRYAQPSDVRNLVKVNIEFWKREAFETAWGSRVSLSMVDVLLDGRRRPEDVERAAMEAWTEHSRSPQHSQSSLLWALRASPVVDARPRKPIYGLIDGVPGGSGGVINRPNIVLSIGSGTDTITSQLGSPTGVIGGFDAGWLENNISNSHHDPDYFGRLWVHCTQQERSVAGDRNIASSGWYRRPNNDCGQAL